MLQFGVGANGECFYESSEVLLGSGVVRTFALFGRAALAHLDTSHPLILDSLAIRSQELVKHGEDATLQALDYLIHRPRLSSSSTPPPLILHCVEVEHAANRSKLDADNLIPTISSL